MSASGLNSGGIGGYAEAAAGQVGEDLLDFFGTTSVQQTAAQSGYASGDPLRQGSAWGYGALTVGSIALNALPAAGKVAGLLEAEGEKVLLAKGTANPLLQPGAEYSVRINPLTGQGPMAIDTSAFTSGEATMNGGIRNSQQFWNAWSETYGDTLSEANLSRISVGRSPVVDEQWIQSFPEQSGYMDETLVHHHLDYGPQAIPLPQSVHSLQPGWSIWHQ
jgi:filamentous hemagglutinin